VSLGTADHAPRRRDREGLLRFSTAYAQVAGRLLSRPLGDPDFAATTEVIDLGEVVAGTTRVLTYSLHNTGQRRLILNSLVPECECVKAN
jgi:hypothetical protein